MPREKPVDLEWTGFFIGKARRALISHDVLPMATDGFI